MYTQTETSKTSQLKANEKFLKDFSAYRDFPDRAENVNLTIDENISLKYIKNDQLLLQTKNLVQKERQINIQVLQHLQEIEKRKLYLDRGFPSLFEYAVKELGYSHSVAYRRIKTMRLCRDIPQAVSKIKTGSLNLTTASQLQTFFEKKKRKDRKEEKTFVKKNLVLDACLRRHDTYERIEKTFKTNGPSECDVQSTSLPATGCVKENEEQSNKTDVFMQSKEIFNKKQKKTSTVKINKQTKINKADVFDKESHKTSVVTMKKKINNNQKCLKPKRYIPSKVRHHVWMRDQGKCTYVCPKTKRRCASDHLLQIDHIKPFSLGGTNEVDNLRLLCANHNQFMFSRYQKYG